MHGVSLIHIEACLVGLVGDSVPDLSAEHHLTAAHVVVHDVLKVRHQSLWINEVEVNQLLSCQLDSNVSWHEVDEGSLLNSVVVDPLHLL